MEILSGQGKNSAVPEEIKGWNWGAFWLNWIWGIGNSTYIALLMFVPFVNLVMPFVLGAKGNQWAWQNREWKDIEHFKRVQKNWARVGFGLVVVLVPLFFFALFSMLKGEAYKQSLSLIRSNQEVIEYVGQPIEPSYFVGGKIQYNGVQGMATLGYSITGSKKEASVYVVAHKNYKWILDRVIVYNKQDGVQIELLKKDKE